MANRQLNTLAVPAIRVRDVNTAPRNAQGQYVLYWMIGFRRTRWNFALQRAVEWACKLNKPLVIFEPLRSGYAWASDRLHRFVIDGMADNAARIARGNHRGVLYYPYVEPTLHAGRGLLAALAQQACVVVCDDNPAFFLPRMMAAAADRVPVRMEAVDSNGLLPLHATDRIFTTAFSFRAFLQKQLPSHLAQLPREDPLSIIQKLPPLAKLPAVITKHWPPASQKLLAGSPSELAALPIDHTVGVVAEQGGATAARKRLLKFLRLHVASYAAGANDPDEDHRSGLSPYLHFGHISPHELLSELMSSEGWSPDRLGNKTGGRRQGWWGVSEGTEAWLDEFVTWRELGYNRAAHDVCYEQYETLPGWAQSTLNKHACDRREFIYSLEEFAAAETHDELWNAAQRQLLREGRMHNYLRMLWGKKILEWSASPREALHIMVELNNRYALDGRDPNSYSGILWCLGRYDRPWAPERPIFGTVRFMSSQSTRKKMHVKEYLQRYAETMAPAARPLPRSRRQIE